MMAASFVTIHRQRPRRGIEMKRIMWLILLVSLLALPTAHANAPGGGDQRVQGPHCGGRFRDSNDCSFRFRGGQLYLGGSVDGAGRPEGAAAFRLEARSHLTGHRYVVLSCATPASGGCSAGGSYETVERLRRGQRLFCIVEGKGRGVYECGTLIRP